MVAAAVVGSAVVGAGATIFSANKAATAQTSAADKATAAQMEMFNKTQNNLSPFIQAGTGVLPSLTNFDQEALEGTPGYKFALSQGLKGVQNSAAARGLGVSGAAMRGAADYATGKADETYGNQFARWMQIANMGGSAAAGLGVQGTQTGQNVGNNMTGAGNAQAGAWMSGGNAVAGAAGDVGSAMYMNRLLQAGRPTGMYAAGGGAVPTPGWTPGVGYNGMY